MALDYDPDNADELSVIGVSELYNIPRRNLINGITLVLDTQDPWWFFMQRIDPMFPIPDISLPQLKYGMLMTACAPK